MTIAVRYFARLRETFGIESETVVLAVDGAPPATLGTLLDHLRYRHGERADALLAPRIRVAIDGAIAAMDRATALGKDCEVAFLPPVTGG